MSSYSGESQVEASETAPHQSIQDSQFKKKKTTKPCIPWGNAEIRVHLESSHNGRDGDYAGVRQHGLLLTKADCATVASKCPSCQQQRAKLSPHYDTIPQRKPTSQLMAN